MWPSVCGMSFRILAWLLVSLVGCLPFDVLRLALATPSRGTPLALSVFLHCVVALLLTVLESFVVFMSLIVLFMVNSGCSSSRMGFMALLYRLLSLLVLVTMPLFMAGYTCVRL